MSGKSKQREKREKLGKGRYQSHGGQVSGENVEEARPSGGDHGEGVVVRHWNRIELIVKSDSDPKLWKDSLECSRDYMQSELK